MDVNNHELPPAERHESADVNAWAIGKFGIALVLLCVFAMALLFGVFQYLRSVEEAVNPVPRPSNVSIDPRRLDSGPALETTPVQDLKAMREKEETELHSYGWVDGANGIVRIPIDRAIDLLAQRGLPSRPQQEPVSGAASVSVPTESGLGPKMQQEGGPLAPEMGAKQPEAQRK